MPVKSAFCSEGRTRSEGREGSKADGGTGLGIGRRTVTEDRGWSGHGNGRGNGDENGKG